MTTTDIQMPMIARHRTAISRPQLSTSMQCAARHGFLDGTRSLFDYGCGRGHDDIPVQLGHCFVSRWLLSRQGTWLARSGHPILDNLSAAFMYWFQSTADVDLIRIILGNGLIAVPTTCLFLVHDFAPCSRLPGTQKRVLVGVT